MSQQISAIERLQSLPAIFSGKDLTARNQWTSKAASQYLYLWKKRGLVQALGGHSDVYANMLATPSPDWELALAMAMPTAVTTGIEALRKHGWTTQVPVRPTVAVNNKRPVFTTERFELEPRDPAWFELVRAGITAASGAALIGSRVETSHTIRVRTLRPAWALADMLKTHGWVACGLGQDDIEWDMVTAQDETQWHAACEAFGLPHEPLLERAVTSR